MEVVFVLFPKLTLLDLVAPYEAFARLKECHVHLASAGGESVADTWGFAVKPTISFEAALPADVLVVPGGPGQIEAIDEGPVLDFVRRQGAHAKWVTSVCTGSLVLGAAGLLRGYRATSHWLYLDDLALFGATPVEERVVVDRNRVTGGGVTAGLDFALALVAELYGRRRAESVQLQMEYAPAPPFAAGSPATAPADLVAETQARVAAFRERRREASRRAADRLAGAA
jgi:cyclohexyl-isocyanide hydratase